MNANNKAFEVYLNKSPLLIMTPHSGRNYDSNFLKDISLGIKDLRNTEDFCIDQLFSSNPRDFSFLNAAFPRIFVDVNRSPLEIDGTMWKDNNLKTLFDASSTRVLNGIGVFAKYNLFGKYIYSSRLPFVEAKSRLLNFYFPYHKKIREIIVNTKKNYELMLALDCHSMSSGLVKDNIDIVLSNNDNKSSSKEILILVKKSFNKFSYNIKLNHPFKGGFITTKYGNPEKKIHFIQIEINKRLYMDEQNLKLKKTNFSKLKDCFDNLIIDILPYLYK